MYNNHEPVCIADYDLPVATSLLKLFLRELPEPVLTNGLLERFEEAGAIKEALERGEKFKELVKELPSCNRTLLGWTLVHLDQVTQHEKHNKMNAQAIGTTLSPLLQVSQRLLTALLCHALDLFPDIKLVKYVPPLKSVSPGLPETPEGLALELSKQESLLAHLHREMALGLAGQDRVEQLWTVQRTVTHLKRMLRSLEKTSSQKSLDEPDSLVIHRHETKTSPGDQSKSLDARIPEEKAVPHSLTIPPPPAFQNSVSAPSSILNPPVVSGPSSVPPVSLPSLASLAPSVTQLPASLPPPNSLPAVLPPPATSSVVATPSPAAPALSSLPTPLPTPLPPPAALPPPPTSVPVIPSQKPPAPSTEKSLTLNRKTSLFQGYDDDSIWASPCKLTAEQKSATIGTMRGRVPLPTDSTNPWKRRPPLVQQEESVLIHKQVPTAESLEVQDINRESTEKADRMQKAIIESEELMNSINKLNAECENERADINKLKEKIQLLGGIPDLWGMLSDDSDDEASSPDSEPNILWKRRQDLKQETKMLQLRKRALVESIISEQDAIIDLKVQIKFLQLNRV
uniref:Rho-GAP domain-containing protein n=1 Tax=Lygus hesperus TaxID=30085 RepID=A0A0K8T4D8_LYGHE